MHVQEIKSNQFTSVQKHALISLFAWRLNKFLEVILERPLQHAPITDRNVHHPILF